MAYGTHHQPTGSSPLGCSHAWLPLPDRSPPSAGLLEEPNPAPLARPPSQRSWQLSLPLPLGSHLMVGVVRDAGCLSRVGAPRTGLSADSLREKRETALCTGEQGQGKRAAKGGACNPEPGIRAQRGFLPPRPSHSLVLLCPKEHSWGSESLLAPPTCPAPQSWLSHDDAQSLLG